MKALGEVLMLRPQGWRVHILFHLATLFLGRVAAQFPPPVPEVPEVPEVPQVPEVPEVPERDECIVEVGKLTVATPFAESLDQDVATLTESGSVSAKFDVPFSLACPEGMQVVLSDGSKSSSMKLICSTDGKTNYLTNDKREKMDKILGCQWDCSANNPFSGGPAVAASSSSDFQYHANNGTLMAASNTRTTLDCGSDRLFQQQDAVSRYQEVECKDSTFVNGSIEVSDQQPLSGCHLSCRYNGSALHQFNVTDFAFMPPSGGHSNGSWLVARQGTTLAVTCPEGRHLLYGGPERRFGTSELECGALKDEERQIGFHDGNQFLEDVSEPKGCYWDCVWNFTSAFRRDIPQFKFSGPGDANETDGTAWAGNGSVTLQCLNNTYFLLNDTDYAPSLKVLCNAENGILYYENTPVLDSFVFRGCFSMCIRDNISDILTSTAAVSLQRKGTEFASLEDGRLVMVEDAITLLNCPADHFFKLKDDLNQSLEILCSADHDLVHDDAPLHPDGQRLEGCFPGCTLNVSQLFEDALPSFTRLDDFLFSLEMIDNNSYLFLLENSSVQLECPDEDHLLYTTADGTRTQLNSGTLTCRGGQEATTR